VGVIVSLHELQFIMFGSLAPVDNGYRSTASSILCEFAKRMATECICVLPRDGRSSMDSNLWCEANGVRLSAVPLQSGAVFPVGNGLRGFLAGSIPGRASRFVELLAKHGVKPNAAKGILYFTLGWDPFLPAVGRWLGKRHVIFPADSIALMEEGKLRAQPSLRNQLRAATARAVERRALRNSTGVYAYVSSEDSERARALVGARMRVRLETVPIGLSDYLTERLPAAERVRRFGKVIAFTGALNHPPNRAAADRLIRGIVPLLRERSVVTEVAGRGGEELMHLASKDVRIHDWLPKLSDVIARAQMFVAPVPFAAGMKNNVLRAMASGIPVIGTAAAFAGFECVPPGCTRCETDEDFARAIDALLEDPARVDHAGDAASRFVVTRFSWERTVDSLVQLYERPADT
jgi:glycosyltransferase involved in cell wall biosynthesis